MWIRRAAAMRKLRNPRPWRRQLRRWRRQDKRAKRKRRQ